VDAGHPSPLARVQRGMTTIAAGAASQRVTVLQLDPARAFLVFGTRFDSSAPSDSQVAGQITGATELTFTRAGATGATAIVVYYYVAEFQSGVQVQRGSTTLSSTTVTAALANVDLTKTFPLVTYRNTGATYGKDDFVRAKVTSASQLTLENTLATPNGVAEWQVVSFDGATVQSGDLTMADTDATVVANVQPVDPTKTWVLFSYDLSTLTSGAAQLMLRGKIDTPTQIGFRRSGSAAGATLSWYAVSFNNGTTVQSATTLLGDTATTATLALAPVDPLKTIAVAGGLYQRGGATAIATASNVGCGTFTLDIGSGSQLSLTRGAAMAGSAAAVDWFAASFY
jgi:hypothetical protein